MCKLIDHIISTLQMLNGNYPDAPIILGGDKNDLDISPILKCGLKLKQIVDLPKCMYKLQCSTTYPWLLGSRNEFLTIP